jgi:hypothetical protein
MAPAPNQWAFCGWIALAGFIGIVIGLIAMPALS